MTLSTFLEIQNLGRANRLQLVLTRLIFTRKKVTSLGRTASKFNKIDRMRLTCNTIERGVSKITAPLGPETSPLGHERSTALRVGKDSCVNMLGSRESRARLKAKIDKRREVS